MHKSNLRKDILILGETYKMNFTEKMGLVMFISFLIVMATQGDKFERILEYCIPFGLYFIGVFMFIYGGDK